MVSASQTEHLDKSCSSPSKPFHKQSGDRGAVYSTTSESSSSNSQEMVMADGRRFSHTRMHAPNRPSDEFEKQNVHVRQNFGNREKTGGYIPPQNSTGSPRRSFDTRRVPVPVSPDELSSESEMPFDMINDATRNRGLEVDDRTPPEPQSPSRKVAGDDDEKETSFESVWKSSPERQQIPVRGITSRRDVHLTVKPPRCTDPSYMDMPNDDIGAGRTVPRETLRGALGKTRVPASMPTPYHAVNVQPAPIHQGLSQDTVQSDRSYKLMAELGVNSTQIASQDQQDHTQGEDDSLFDFEEAREVQMQYPEGSRTTVKVTHKIRKRASPINRIDEFEADDTSLDEYGPGPKRSSPTNLHQRAQQAWKSRQKKNSNLRSKRDPQTPRSNNSVSFGVQDTVQYFEPHVDEATDGTNGSLDDRSLNSDYTKTLESEVEDMIKDILFIGNGSSSQPGRRKFKHKHEMKKRLRKRQAEQQNADGELPGAGEHDLTAVCKVRTNVKANDDTPTKSKKGTRVSTQVTSQESRNAEQFEDGTTRRTFPGIDRSPSVYDPEEKTLWDMMEGGMTAVSSALGLAPEDEPASAASIERSQRASDPVLPFEACAGRITPEPVLDPAKPRFTELFDYAQDLMYGPLGRSNESSNNSGSNSKDSAEVENKTPPPTETLEKDTRLVELALYAARSLHQTQGVGFDESYPIDMQSDVKMSVVELKLPLGLIFMENNGGCFVTKVSPDGSAARSGGVEVGDQLASINGGVSIRMKVDDICDMINKSPNPKSVEFSFLRYIGPFRPNRLESPSFDLEPGGDPDGSFEISAASRTKSDATLKSKDTPKKRVFRLFGRGKKKAAQKK